MAHYIGLDVGTGSARACLIDAKGDILSVATKDITTWHDKADYYVCSVEVKALIQEQSTEDIWSACCCVTKQVITEAAVDPSTVKGIGFDATCSLAVLDESDNPVSVSGPDFKDNTRNIILWCDVPSHEANSIDYSTEQEKKQTLSMQQNILYWHSKEGPCLWKWKFQRSSG
jgi:ribulose kinase